MENNSISNLQERVANDGGFCIVGSACFKFLRSPYYILSPSITAALMIGLSMGTDSLIAFKSAFLTCIGIYIISVLNIFYKDPRPYWAVNGISSYNICYFDFSVPNLSMFILTFSITYVLIMYRFKYINKPSILDKSFTGFLTLLLILGMILTYFAGAALGLVYVYQSFMG